MTVHLELIAPQQIAENCMLCLVDGLVLVTLGTLPAASILLQDCLARRWRRLDRHQRDHRQSGLFSLFAGPLIVGYPPMMKFAANLPTHSMHIIRPQS
jgi:hypothetical protein